MPDELSHLLERYLQRTNRVFTPGLLSKFSGVPKTTIVNWLTGRVARPRRWQDLAKVADALRLDEGDTNALLAAAGHPPVADLALQPVDVADRSLLAAWIEPRQNGTHAPPLSQFASLPSLPTPLIGRERERRSIHALVERPDVRLLTLTGTGGAGKTRLALHVAADLQHAFADGVAYVSLSSVTDSSMVVEAVSQALGVRDDDLRTPIEQLQFALAPKQMLLVLDNFEHLLAAGPLLAELLVAAPGMTILVTSRVVLHVYGEHVFEVPPLPLPDLDHVPPLPELATNPAIALFVQRAQAVDPLFRITTINARTIAELCVRLDGLPLSIELAAARIKLLAPHTLLTRLATRLGVLTWGPRDLPPRHQTLRATLDWSYRLLQPSTQRVFARLAVFSGAFSLEAAEAICGDGIDRVEHGNGSDQTARRSTKTDVRAPSILDELMTLVDSSLIQSVPANDDEHRFRMLETIREYAGERLAMQGEDASMHRRFAMYYLALAQAAEPALSGSQQYAWLNRLEREHDQVRAALGWMLHVGNIEDAARLATALRPFWMIRGHLSEGRRWLDQILRQRAALPDQVLANVFLAAGRLARQQGDLKDAAERLHESLALHRQLDDPLGTAAVLGYLGVLAYDQGDFAEAETLHTRSLALRRATDDRWGVAATLANLGEVTRQQGLLDRATSLHEESLALFQQLGDQWGIAAALLNLATTACDHGAFDQSQRLFLASAPYWQRLNDREGLAECIEGLACIAAACGQAERAIQLAGAAHAARRILEAPLPPADQIRYDRFLATARNALHGSSLDRAWNTGLAMTLEQALDLANGA